MYIPPYFPEPEVIPGNVAHAPYDARLKFVRRVVYLHLAAVIPMFAMAWIPGLEVNPVFSAGLVLATLLALTITRRIGPGGRWDRISAVLLYPPLAYGVGGLLAMVAWHTPAIFVALLSAILGSGLYTALCGRDFSFLGQYGFAMVIPILVSVATFVSSQNVSLAVSAFAVSAGVLFFVVYDLAALLQRRRDGEYWPAVIDLFRDSLNFITYGFRVVDHWRNFRI